MNITAAGNVTDHQQSAEVMRMAREEAHQRKLAASLEADASLDVSAPPLLTDAVTPTQTTATNDEGVPGVIRLLEAGHFKGVADVRLRINFFEELLNRANNSALGTLQESSGQLAGTVETGVDELIESQAVDESAREEIAGLVAEFGEQLQAVVNGGEGSAPIDRDALSEAVQGVFAELVEGLTTLLGPPPVDPEIAPVDPDIAPIEPDVAPSDPDASPVDPDPAESIAEAEEGSPEVAFDDALAVLVETFTAALDDLLETIDTAGRLPDPAPASGHGAAYDKFLAIYNDLRGVTPQLDQDG